jgi:predicted nucleic acid-binding protein
MNDSRFLIDTVFIQALLNPRDQYHQQAKRWREPVRNAAQVWVTEAVLTEVANALSATENIQVVSINPQLFIQALQLYETRPDKTWGLTDCISFIVMQEENLIDAVTADAHFVQAGFRALMLEV